MYQNIKSGLGFYLFSVLITSLPSQSITCKVIVWLKFSVQPPSNQLLGSLSPSSLSLLPARTFPPGDELQRCTAAAHSDTITTTDLIPSCPSTHTFNLLGRLVESLARCLSDLIFSALGVVVSSKVSVCVCRFSPCQDVFFSMLMHWIRLCTLAFSHQHKVVFGRRQHNPKEAANNNVSSKKELSLKSASNITSLVNPFNSAAH